MSFEIPLLNDFNPQKQNSCEGLEHLPFQKIEHFPWEEVEPKPQVKFKIAHSNNYVLVQFYVCEDEILARCTQANQPVYEDSCVEFFIAFDGDENYYNFEFNCLGTCLAAYGKNRDQRENFSAIEIGKIISQTVLERNSKQDNLPFHWQLAVAIPVGFFAASSISELKGQKAKANFYKCGDKLSKPHFMSWKNIETSEPNFHQAQFFGEVLFV